MKDYCNKEYWLLIPEMYCRALQKKIDLCKCQKMECQSFGRCLLVEKENLVFRNKEESVK